MPRLPRALHRNLPGIGWRDRKLSFLESRVEQLLQTRDSLGSTLEQTRATLERERTEHVQQLGVHTSEIATLRNDIEDLARAGADSPEAGGPTRPSFKEKMADYRSATNLARANKWHPHSAIAQMNYKLRTYSLAESLGVDTPEIYRVWNSADEINLNEIEAEKIVLKADGGHSGISVIPLRRTGHGWQTLNGAEQMSDGRPSDEVLKQLKKGRRPYFAEEFLESDAGSTIPPDIKVYTAYGQILHVLVMQTTGKGVVNRSTFSRRYFDAAGDDLGMILPVAVYGPDIPVPQEWDNLLTSARRLSIASGIPFVRVDLYGTSRGPVLGELTATPGGKQRYRLQHDNMMGGACNEAEVRLQRDIARGRPYGTLYGLDPYTWRYPDSERETHPSSWQRPAGDPEEWYTPSPTGS